MEQYDITVIGAGPAGLFCAIHAAAPGVKVLLLEKMDEPGKKLLLSGTGQCNITHAGEMRDFPAHYGDHGKWVKPALFSLTNKALLAFFEERGLSMKTEENGKVFPETRQSSDVLAVLLLECKSKGVEIRCSEPVTGITHDTGGFEIITSRASYRSTVVVITTGGASYPKTGSTGDGYRLSESLGQPVTETAPALTPLLIRNFPFAALAGISFEEIPFTVWRAGKKIGDHKGDVLFTHLGVSGPGILDASRHIQPDDVIKLSFVGAIRREEFTADFARRVQENRTWQISTILAGYPIPERLNRKLLKISDIPDDLKCNHFSAEQRTRLVTNCTEFPLTVTAPGGYAVAMATRGGVALDGVNMKTMESKIIPNLYFAGEVLDIDGDTGGYNIQAAFSTGFLAAQAIKKQHEEKNRPSGE
ncbi:MAG: NAD(P)/FAD-dependent oxidoreductase [Methanomicrobiales archaeon HGW-Methanomicrobiales-5]|nr:MAG: NAD(P)/FAD-dependent oxidoreductase [Methanomicrobiales archaeon HGW-Methanomicrobiales-5]